MIAAFEMKTLLPEAKVDEHRVHEIEKKVESVSPVAPATPVPQFGD
jgi:hypothetical protein